MMRKLEQHRLEPVHVCDEECDRKLLRKSMDNMPDTITESERTALGLLVDPTALEVNAYPWPMNAVDRILAKLGITVVPDPIPEPEGDVILVDRDGDIWRRKVGEWVCDQGSRVGITFDRLTKAHGPVKIYRLEES